MCKVNGKVLLPVTYANKTIDIWFFVCSELQHPCHLGIDFWRIFELAPDIVGVAEVSVVEFPPSKKELCEPHKLTAQLNS